MLLSRIVLSELYQEKLMTKDEVEKKKGNLHDIVVLVQCTKPPEVIPKTADVLDKYGRNEEAQRLRG